MLKPRIIKSVKCFKCKSYLKQLTAQKYEFLIYDADLPENQDQLDKWKVDAMPIVQIVDDENDMEVVHQFPPGRYSQRTIDAMIKSKEEKK